MSARRCCGTAAGTVAPAAVLVLLPKCPACIAAWLAVAAGLGVSVPAAAALRWGILGSCVACLALTLLLGALGRLRRLRRKG
ncbi:MAG: hypothetical protein ACJ76Y_08760 [Thermoanaerobaculia bacterium]